MLSTSATAAVIFFFLSTTAFDPVRFCSAWESTALCGFSSNRSEKKPNTSVVVPLCFLLVDVEDSCYSLRTETRALIHTTLRCRFPHVSLSFECWKCGEMTFECWSKRTFTLTPATQNIEHVTGDSIQFYIELGCRAAYQTAMRCVTLPKQKEGKKAEHRKIKKGRAVIVAMWSNGIARSHIETTERWVIVSRIEFDAKSNKNCFHYFSAFGENVFGGKLIPSLVTGDIFHFEHR